MPWTTEQVLALAPDSGSASAGRSLAAPQRWGMLQGDARAIWGECQGSGSKPYQVSIDLTEPAFRCTCPSRKFPCKHGIALLLIYAAQPQSVVPGMQPGWVLEWIQKRDARNEPKAETPRAELSEEEKEKAAKKSADAAAKRASDRTSKVDSGVEELDRWIKDLIRQGLASLPGRPYRFYEAAAARLVDAQAPGLARRVRDLASIPASGDGWAERMLVSLGSLHMLIQAYKRMESLPPLLQATVKTHIGWTVSKDSVLELPVQSATWLVVGRRILDEEKLRVQRVWLLRSDGAGYALHLSFAAAGGTLDFSLQPGTQFSGSLAYYPASLPLRAELIQREPDQHPINYLTGYSSISELLDAYASALALDPWLESMPACLTEVIPFRTPLGWSLVDSSDHHLPVSVQFDDCWSLSALSGGRAIAVFGEWDGKVVFPLGAYADGRFVQFNEGNTE